MDARTILESLSIDRLRAAFQRHDHNGDYDGATLTQLLEAMAIEIADGRSDFSSVEQYARYIYELAVN